MDFILNPLITLNIKENIEKISNFFEDNFGINLNFFLLINGKIYFLNSSIIQQINENFELINDADEKIILSIIRDYLKFNNLKINFISFVENTKIIISYNKDINEKTLSFIQNYITNILMKNLYEFKVINYEDEIKTLNIKYKKLKELKEILLSLIKNFENNYDFSKQINNILQFLLQLTSSDCCSISIPDKEKFAVCYISNKAHEKLRNIIININDGIIGKAFNEKKLIIENNPENSQLWNKKIAEEVNYYPDSILANPILNKKGEVVAVLEIFKKGKNETFTEEDIKIIKIFSFFISSLINF